MTAAERIEQLEFKLIQTYQVIGTLLGDLFDTEEGQRDLDYFAREDYDEGFLPWPRSAPTED